MKNIVADLYSYYEQIKQSVTSHYCEKEFYKQIEQSTIQYYEQLEAEKRLSIKLLLQEELTDAVSVLDPLQQCTNESGTVFSLESHLTMVKYHLHDEPAKRIAICSKDWVLHQLKTSANTALKVRKIEVKKELLESWQKIMETNHKELNSLVLKEVLPLPDVCIELITNYDPSCTLSHYDPLISTLPKPVTDVITDIIGEYMFVDQADYSAALYGLILTEA